MPTIHPSFALCLRLLAVIGAIAGLLACGVAGPPQAVTSAPHIVFYGWVDEIPQSLLEDFTTEYNVAVNYVSYASTEEAVEHLRHGAVYDVMVVENRFVRSLIDEELLAPIALHHISNFKNISLNFRDLSFDPGNQYSVPYSWGTVAILAHRDLKPHLPERWADLWDEAYCGHIAVWRGQARQMVSVTLKSLGYSANSEDPVQLAAAQARLLQLRPCVRFVDDGNPIASASRVVSGELMLGIGHAYEAVELRKWGIPAQFVIPEEGALLWGDNYVIPAASKQQALAETLINYLLRPEVSAQIVNANSFQVPNDAALPLIDPQLAGDYALYPSIESLRHAEFLLSLSPEGEQRYTQIGAAFLNAAP